jgi:excinuclease ABC subunit A
MAGERDEKLIRVRGAREHNLRNIQVEIPRDQLVVITGVSGSGKSSLAFDTIFAEGQRKYMESLSAYARQFLEQMQKPDVDDIEGLPPTIAIEQRSGGHNPRSTVATITEIYDYLRLLFARCGQPTCWAVVGGTEAEPKHCGRPISATPPSQIVERLMAMPEGTRLMIAAPVVRGRKGFHRDVLEGLQRQGLVRARVNGQIIDLRDALKEPGENPLNLGRYEMHTIDAILDRIVVNSSAGTRQRLAESIETAQKLSDGLLLVLSQSPDAGPDERREENADRGRDTRATDLWSEHRFSEKFACPVHPDHSIEELEPRLFSFNSPYGACAKCGGLGIMHEFDIESVVEDPSLTIAEGAISAFARLGHVYRSWFSAVIRRTCKRFGINRDTPFAKLPAQHRKLLLYGSNGRESGKKSFSGVIPILKERFANTDNERIKERLSTLLSQTPCPQCNGRRLRIEALHVYLQSGSLRVSIADVTAMSIEQAVGFFETIALSDEKRKIAAPILREINARLGFLASVGLNYLSLDRTAGTLSGGEAQRIRLATQVGSGLVGVCYVLDEPTIGLHQRDNDRLISTLRHLTDIGNTVLVVEHDEEMIRAADHIVDVGPGPGHHGGTVVAQGTLRDICSVRGSMTGQYLSGQRTIAMPRSRREVSEDRAITIKGARENNLKSIDVNIPLGGIICVSGVSGSGKSTLVNEILLKAARVAVSGSRDRPGAHTRINGLKQIDRVIEVDQSPIGRTPRSNPATYTGVFDEIRRLFAKSKEARIRGYEPGRFSFNVKGGRCEACQGQGVKKIEMHFLPDVFVTCEVCKGARYNRETLEVHFRDRTIADVLRMTIEDSVAFFESHPKIVRMLQCLHDVGLDYLELGQPSTTLSGGEAQRIKLASELGCFSPTSPSLSEGGGKGAGDDAAEISRTIHSATPSLKGRGRNARATHTLYILDEPTTGLHFADIDRLLTVFNRLADSGHTVVVIEHNLDVIKNADWIIDLGPEGGDKGGTVVAAGPPEHIIDVKASHTGRYLKPLLSPRRRTSSRERAVAV